MRKLSNEEQKLWDDFVRGIEVIEPATLPELKPPVRPQVQDMSFSSVLDLHHYTVNDAYARSNAHIEQAYYLGKKKVQHITGKSGQISREFETWAQLHPRVRKIVKQNEGGSWLLHLRKKS